MIKKWIKKAGAGILACMMMLMLMPVTNVHAVDNHIASQLNVGDILNAGDVISKGSDYQLGIFKYYEDELYNNELKRVEYPAGDTYTLETVGEYSKWTVAKVSGNPNQWMNINLVAVPAPTASATVADVTINGTVGEEIDDYPNFEITLANDEINGNHGIYDDVVKGMVTNIPGGVEVIGFTTLGTGDTSFKLQIKPSTPTEASSEALQITIPGSILKGGKDIVVTANPNAKWNIQEAGGDVPAPTASARISKVSVSGKVNEKITRHEFTILLTNDELADNADINVPIITNLPAGLQVGFNSKTSNIEFKCNIYGTPTATGKDTISITIPSAWLKSGKDLTVTTNPNATFDITSDEKPVNPVITVGAGSSHQIGAGKDMTFTCTGKLEDLRGIYVDGKELNESNCILKSGSTILTLKASYLDTLAAGKHTLKFQYKDNLSATTDFTVVAKETTPIEDNKPDTLKKPNTPVIKGTSSPNTGDATNMMLLFSMLVLSGGTMGIAFYRRKRKFSK